jgi:membrane-associated phospholipid phosphatase
MQTILDLGVRLVVALQGLGGWLKLPADFFSFLGTEDFFMVVLPIIYWCIDSHLGLLVGVLLMVSTDVNQTLKMALHSTRPYWYSSEVRGLASETSFGVPSNHAQSAVVIWGVLAAHLRKWWSWLIAILLMVFIGLSRLFLGVHFPHDVLLGWLIGGLLLWLTLRFWGPITAWVKKQAPAWHILAAFLASLALVALPLIPFIWLKATNWQAPPEWASYASQALSLEGPFCYAGTLFGLLAGIVWFNSLGGFQMRGAWWQLVLRFFLGAASVLIIRYGLKFIFPEGETVLALSLRYLRYTAIGFWVTGAAPWMFVRLKLAEKAK